MDRTRTAALGLITTLAASTLTATALTVTALTATTVALSTTPAAAAAPAATPPPAPAQDPAWVRLAHLAPDARGVAVDIVPFTGSSQPGGAADRASAQMMTLDGVTDYGDVGDYRRLRAGFYSVVMTQPAGDGTPSPPQIVTTLQTDPGKAYTLAAFEAADGPRLQVLTDDLQPAAPGSAKVRLIAAAKDQPPVDVTAQGGPVVADDVRYGGVTGYADVPAGPWSLTTQPAGSAASPVVAGRVELAKGSTYTVLLLDKGASKPVLSAVLDAAGMGTAPVGGIATGAGGTAQAQAPTAAEGRATGVPSLLAAVLLSGAAVTVPVLARRRRTAAAR